MLTLLKVSKSYYDIIMNLDFVSENKIFIESTSLPYLLLPQLSFILLGSVKY